MKEFLLYQIAILERDEAQSLANANAARGAIQMCKKMLSMMEKPHQEAVTIPELEKQLGAKIDEPKEIK